MKQIPLPPQGPSQLRIVVTGFGPFQGVLTNPSETLARLLSDQVNVVHNANLKFFVAFSHVYPLSQLGGIYRVRQQCEP